MKKAFIFQKDSETKRARNLVKTKRRKERKQVTAAIKSVFKSKNKEADEKNPTKNPFAALV